MTRTSYAANVDAVWSWWTALQPNEQRKFGGDRATLAKLRRASTIMEAAAEPATAELFSRLGFERRHAVHALPRVALIAAIVAHIRDDNRRDTLARAIGTPRAGEGTTALITPLRLKRLIGAREPDDLLIGFRRAIAILGQTANVKDVAEQLLRWTDPDDRAADSARTIFMFDYHGASDYAPDLKSA